MLNGIYSLSLSNAIGTLPAPPLPSGFFRDSFGILSGFFQDSFMIVCISLFMAVETEIDRIPQDFLLAIIFIY